MRVIAAHMLVCKLDSSPNQMSEEQQERILPAFFQRQFKTTTIERNFVYKLKLDLLIKKVKNKSLLLFNSLKFLWIFDVAFVHSTLQFYKFPYDYNENNNQSFQLLFIKEQPMNLIIRQYHFVIC